MLSLPSELTRIKVFGGSSAVTEPRPFIFIPNQHAPIRAAQFVTREITDSIAKNCERVSVNWRNRSRRPR